MDKPPLVLIGELQGLKDLELATKLYQTIADSRDWQLWRDGNLLYAVLTPEGINEEWKPNAPANNEWVPVA